MLPGRRMDSLLVLDAFPEPWVDGVRAGVSFVAEADFAGAIVLTHWDRSMVARMLASDLVLGRNASRAPGLHPVVFVLGRQQRAGFIVGGISLPTPVSFPEAMIAVPFVRHREGQNLHVIIARVFSADRLSTWSGNANYGFSKQRADMGWLAHTFTVSAPDGPLLLHATMEADGEWTPCHDVSPANLAAVDAVFRLPMLGRRSDGSEVCSYFEWGFGGAEARPARARVSIEAPLGPGLEPGTHYGVPSGTFEVRGMRWRVSWPVPCRR